jgi:hypothetical protein
MNQWSQIPITIKRSWIRICILVNSWIRIRIRIRRVNEPVVTDSHHCKAKLYPDLHPSEKLDPDPHLSEKLDPDLHLSEKLDPDQHPSEKLDPLTWVGDE